MTERRRALPSLQEHSGLCAKVLGAIPGVLVLVDEDLAVAWTNTPRFLERDVAVGAPIVDSVGGRRAGEIAEQTRRARETGTASSALFLAGDGAGETVWYAVTATPTVLEDRPFVLLSLTDITAQIVRFEDAAHSERLSSIGRLVAGFSHEINNPLAFILANLDFVLDGTLDPESREPLAEAREGVTRIRDLVRDLRTFSEEKRAGATPVDVREVFDATVQVIGGDIRRVAEVKRAYEAIPRIRANRARLAQVFLNITINAIQAIEASGKRGEITLKTRLGDIPGEVIAEVRDNGVGIAPDDVPRVFDPFFSTRPVGKGTGLGLAVALSFTKALGGTIEVESELGRGTVVRIRLPRGEDTEF